MTGTEVKWEDVESSNIVAVSYAGGDLYIRFKDGGAYRYDRVPQDVYDALWEAESIGKYFHQAIKGKYAANQVESADTPPGDRVGNGSKTAAQSESGATPAAQNTPAGKKGVFSKKDKTVPQPSAPEQPAAPARAGKKDKPSLPPRSTAPVDPAPAVKTGIKNVSASSGQLFVTFHDGRQQRYDGLPRGLVQKFLAAADKDSYYSDHIMPQYRPIVLQEAD